VKIIEDQRHSRGVCTQKVGLLGNRNDVSYLLTEWNTLSESQNALCNPFTGQYFIRGEVNFTVLRYALATKENKKKIFFKKQKGFRDGLSYSTPQKVKKQGKYHYPASVPSH